MGRRPDIAATRLFSDVTGPLVLAIGDAHLVGHACE